jgi:hypothetical protein
MKTLQFTCFAIVIWLCGLWTWIGIERYFERPQTIIEDAKIPQSPLDTANLGDYNDSIFNDSIGEAKYVPYDSDSIVGRYIETYYGVYYNQVNEPIARKLDSLKTSLDYSLIIIDRLLRIIEKGMTPRWFIDPNQIPVDTTKWIQGYGSVNIRDTLRLIQFIDSIK